MDYLIRFIQMHETFRKPETDALADLAGLSIEWLSYSEDVCHSKTVLKGKESPMLQSGSCLDGNIPVVSWCGWYLGALLALHSALLPPPCLPLTDRLDTVCCGTLRWHR